MAWIIDKTFEFCYGHRVWTQKLHGEYAADLKCACRHLHGHEGKALVHLISANDPNQLDLTGMVTDFRHLEWLKKFINEHIDHQFIIDSHDPIFDNIVGNHMVLYPVLVPGTDVIAGHKVDLTSVEPNTPEYEYYEGFFVVDFVPTSENLSNWLALIVNEKMKPLNVKTHSIEWWETPKSRSVYFA